MNTATICSQGRALSGLIQAVDTVEAIVPALRQLAMFFGGNNAQLCFRRSGHGPNKQLERFSTYSDSLSDLYMTDRSFAEDPVFVHLGFSTLPVSSSEIDWTTPVAARLRKVRLALGVGPSELSGSCFGPQGEWCILTITSHEETAPWDSWLESAKPFLSIFLQNLFEKVRELTPRPSVMKSVLSRREIECLQWAARGKNVAETAEIIGLAASSVRHILDSSRLKLSASSKSQAVAKAIALGLLTGV